MRRNIGVLWMLFGGLRADDGIVTFVLKLSGFWAPCGFSFFFKDMVKAAGHLCGQSVFSHYVDGSQWPDGVKLVLCYLLCY